ncbi:MAG: translesion DNA synthesis-associated protein ImuA [Gammaproteobacteria bacterium]|nr:MAG: translesion DNA synthesis-associated protein ImuA [Gammaproteobacteria bacterium]
MPEKAYQNLLEEGMDRGLVWRGRDDRPQGDAVESSGWPVLDECIGGGWPKGALSELLSRHRLGLSLLLPGLARLSREGRWLGWVAPPHLPFAPGLVQAGVALDRLLLVREVDARERLWAAEQLLKSGRCSMVLLWPQTLRDPQIRRLQLAAEQGDCIGVLFRPLRVAAQPSPAALRLRLLPSPLGMDVEVLKRRHGWGGRHCTVRVA